MSKELKLTFAKAEHLKRNPKQAEDPKAVFQAMRPVFADMVTEMQRSIGFFQSLDRKAKIDNVVMLGNTVKLPGLVQYLAKHLGYRRQRDRFVRQAVGGGRGHIAVVQGQPAGVWRLLWPVPARVWAKASSAPTCCRGKSLTQRMIRAKKPWAVAGVSLLTLACALNFVFFSMALNQVHEDKKVENISWKEAQTKAKSVSMKSGQLKQADTAQIDQLKLLRTIGQEVVGASDRRVLWSEVMLAINSALPPMADKLPPGVIPDPAKLPFIERKDLKIEYVESQFYPELRFWFNDAVKTNWLDLNRELLTAARADESRWYHPCARPRLAGGAGGRARWPASDNDRRIDDQYSERPRRAGVGDRDQRTPLLQRARA